MGVLFLCQKCNAMTAKERPNARVKPCECGHLYFLPPAKAPWKLTANDRRFLKSLGVARV